MPNPQTLIVDKVINQVLVLTANQLNLVGDMKYRDKNFDISGTLVTVLYPVLPLVSICQSLQSGNWNNPSVWSCGHLPTETDDVVIQPGHMILLDATMPEAVCRNLELLGTFSMQGSSLLINGNRIVIDQNNVITR